MRQEHKNFIAYLKKSAPITAAVLQSHWGKGGQYYIDSRISIPGKRQLFNRLNKEIGEA